MPTNKRNRKATSKVLFVTSEVYPLIKTGGLADVSASLPTAMRALDIDVRILIPGYRQVLSALKNKREIARIANLPGLGVVRLLSSKMPESGVPVIIIDYPAFYDRDGGPYIDKNGQDWTDNAIRFGLLSRIAAILGSETSPLNWHPDIVHCNDWQSGLTPAYLNYQPGRKAATVMTIHNLAYQGIFPLQTATQLALPQQCLSMHGVEYYGNLSFLKAGLFYADHLTTVSPTYAREIQSEPLGFGMQGLLAHRTAHLTGILNGVDTEHWNPECDTHLPKTYGPSRLSGKAACKTALQKQLNLPASKDIPIIGIVSRITDQKGLDVILDIAPRLFMNAVQVVILGSGDPKMEQAFKLLAKQFPLRCATVIGFNEGLSHLVEAGADMFLMPSRFEPCGLNQMYSMLYGTPPIVNATGGLADTVTDTNPDSLKQDSATGFVLTSLTPENLLHTINKAINTYHDKKIWRRIQLNGMRRDFGWDASAKAYAALYLKLSTSSVF